MQAQQKAVTLTAPTQSTTSILTEIEQFETAYIKHYRLHLFPVKWLGKTPITPNGYKDAVNDMESYRKLHGDKPHNVGLPTGPINGLFVLDIDPRHGGNESFAQLVREHGSFPATWQTKTQSGGAHLFFRWDPNRPVTNRADVLPGIDIRGDGGYVLVAPSRVGGEYQWLRSPSKVELAQAPEWLYELLEAETKQGSNKDLSHLAKGVQDGSRNVNITQLLGTILGRGIDVELAWTLAVSYNMTHVTPPLPEDELLKTFQSIASRELRKREQRLRRRG